MSNVYMKSANIMNYLSTDSWFCYILEVWESTDPLYFNSLCFLTWSIQQLYMSGSNVRLWLVPRKTEFFVYWILSFDPKTNKNYILKFNEYWNVTRENLDSNIDNFHGDRYCFKSADNCIVWHTFYIDLTNSSTFQNWWVLSPASQNRINLEYDATNNKVDYKVNWMSFLLWNYLSYTNITIPQWSSLHQTMRRNSKLEENAQTRWTTSANTRYFLPSFFVYRIYYQAFTETYWSTKNDATNKLNYSYQYQWTRLQSTSAIVNSSSNYSIVAPGTYYTNTTTEKNWYSMNDSNLKRCPTWITSGSNNDTILEFNRNNSPYWISAYNNWTLIFSYLNNYNYTFPIFRLKENHKIFFTECWKLIYVSDTDNSNFIGWQVWQIQFDLNDIELEAWDTFNSLSVLFNSYWQTLAAWTLRYSLNNWSSWNTTTLSQSTTISLSWMDFTQANTIKLQILLTAWTSAYNFNEFEVILY